MDMPGQVIGYLGAAGHHHPEAAGPKALKLNKERMLIRKRLRAGELTVDQALGLNGEAARGMRISNYPVGTPWRRRGDIEAAAGHCRDLRHEAMRADHASAA
jgi:hypothetical protein